MRKLRYTIISYGCQMNTADSEEMAQPLKTRGFEATSELAQADIVLMNTCTVRDQAEHRADSNIGRLRVWKDKNPNRILIIAGCAATRWGKSIQNKYPFIDLVSPATQIEQFPEAVAQVLKERWNWEAESSATFGNERKSEKAGERENNSFARALAPFLPHSLFGSEATAYVTIMRGCNLNCSYCIVPQVRGREKYRPLPDILQEIRTKVFEGYREVMLLGQTVNSYYYRDETVYDFADLLRVVNATPGVERIRFMSPHPKHMRERVIQAIAECSKVARHLHLPVQSGSDRLLALMKRLYTRKDYLATILKLKTVVPDLAITTDVIVGYPSESAADFDQTLSLIREIGFDGLFAFKYSPRPGTGSALEKDDVPDDVKEDRLQEVLALNTDMNSGRRAAAV
jgi:tRNA-2-methylthio-N6-dimethylallyladenosine synthase